MGIAAISKGKLHAEDNIGEIYMLAVDPDYYSASRLNPPQLCL
jgi:hypothetical protein